MGTQRRPTRHNRKPVPKGRYLSDIAVVQRTISRQGKPRVSFRFLIVAGEHKGRYLFDDAYLTDNGSWKLEAIAEAAGVEGTVDPNDAADLIEKFTNKRLFVTQGEDEYRGEVRFKVTAYHPLLVDESTAAAS